MQEPHKPALRLRNAFGHLNDRQRELESELKAVIYAKQIVFETLALEIENAKEA